MLLEMNVPLFVNFIGFSLRIVYLRHHDQSMEHICECRLPKNYMYMLFMKTSNVLFISAADADVLVSCECRCFNRELVLFSFSFSVN